MRVLDMNGCESCSPVVCESLYAVEVNEVNSGARLAKRGYQSSYIPRLGESGF